VASIASLPVQPSDLVRRAEPPRATGAEVLVSSSQTPTKEFAGLKPLVARIPVELDVAVPLRGFKVRNLIALAIGQGIESQWNHVEDLPLAAGEVQLAWCEFEVNESRLAVRVTRLA